MMLDKNDYHRAVVVEGFSRACDFCKQLDGTLTRATVDGRTVLGPWADLCERHFKELGVGLGLGRGQRLVS
jgi:hypothetical protein